MKSATFLKMTAVAVLCLFAGAANATLTGINFAGGPTTWNSIFGNSNVTGVTDVFNFNDPVTPPNAGDFGSSDVVSGVLRGFNVIINSFELVDTSTSTTITSGPGGGIFSFFDFSLPSGEDAYALYVNASVAPGYSSGSYSGNISVSAVPEPQTYAMLLAGLGLLVFMARRRNSGTGSSFSY